MHRDLSICRNRLKHTQEYKDGLPCVGLWAGQPGRIGLFVSLYLSLLPPLFHLLFSGNIFPGEQLGRETEWPQKLNNFIMTLFSLFPEALSPSFPCLGKSSHPSPSWHIPQLPDMAINSSHGAGTQALSSQVSPLISLLPCPDSN